ncbi:MAG: pro-sigmaK processing inhibitor BofA family protein [Defluviitaleaceae bacterium]|nr:pro-sigmaK processing inhibitor BofA family protein [Defluviitaleaceae bacterium]
MVWIFVALGFFAFLFYTRQFRWLGRVVKNSALGVAGILAFNFLLSGYGIAVGINVVTVLVVGLLGVPGILMLYATRLIL